MGITILNHCCFFFRGGGAGGGGGGGAYGIANRVINQVLQLHGRVIV